MKQADLVVGNDYAYSAYGRSDTRYAARVTVLAAPAAGKVDVKVVDPGRKPPWEAKAAFVRGRRAQVATASILCPWDEYSTQEEARVLAESEAQAKYERREEEGRTAQRPDPDRAVETGYEPGYGWDPLVDVEGIAKLAASLNASLPEWQRPVSAVDAVALLGDLPPMVRRDITAALIDAPSRRPYGESKPATSAVHDVFGRAATVVLQVVQSRGSGRAFQSPGALLRGYDADFFAEISSVAASQGQEFTVPFVPRLPGWAADNVETEAGAALASLGWVRVALADTSGTKLHRLGCSSTRSGSHDEDLRTVETMPWWELALTPYGTECGLCGGPAILHGIEFAHLLAAADAWEARGRTMVEAWQIAAVGRLIAATTSTRMREGQFDMTLSARAWDALSVDAPGAEGWNAYYVVRGFGYRTTELSSEEAESARALAVRRLNQLLAVLPEPQRIIELPAGADLSLVARRYEVLSSANKGRIAEFDRALFSLEGARVH